MKIIHTEIPDVLIIEPAVFGDDRGFFFESYNEKELMVHLQKTSDLKLNFIQDNHSRSSKNILRGLHYQTKQPQGKLVRVVTGEVFDVTVDLRKNSPTFGQWAGVILSEENKRMLWVPPGFAHAFLTLSDSTDFLYKTTDYYAPEYEKTLAWDDPTINIDWPLNSAPILSDKDRAGKPFDECEVYE